MCFQNFTHICLEIDLVIYEKCISEMKQFGLIYHEHPGVCCKMSIFEQFCKKLVPLQMKICINFFLFQSVKLVGISRNLAHTTAERNDRKWVCFSVWQRKSMLNASEDPIIRIATSKTDVPPTPQGFRGKHRYPERRFLLILVLFRR